MRRSETAEESGSRWACRRWHESYNGIMQRVVVIEFPSVEDAVKAHDSQAYQAALVALGDGADRDIRIVEGA